MKWGQLKDWTYHANYPICYCTDSKVHSFLTFLHIEIAIRINLIQQELDEISKSFLVKKKKLFQMFNGTCKYVFEMIFSDGNHFITCKLLYCAAIFVCFCNGIFSCGVVQQMFNKEAMQASSISTSETKNHEQTRIQVAIIIPHFSFSY